MSKYYKQWHDPIELIKNWWPTAPRDHITFNPKVKRQYWVIRQIVGDGTLSHEIELLQQAMLDFINMRTHYSPTAPKDFSSIAGFKYTIGKIMHSTVFCTNVTLESGACLAMAQRDRIRIPVYCEAILK